MDLFTAIDSRSSAVRLSAPPPSRVDVARIIEAGARAPDHGRLRPWRFVVLEGPAIDTLGNAMAEAAKQQNPQLSDVMLQRERDKAKRAPLIIAVAAKFTRGHKVPESDQVLAVGAAAQNMLLAAHALGYGAMWKTGTVTEEPLVKAALGLDADDQIVAFLYLGTTITKGPIKPAITEGLVRWL